MTKVRARARRLMTLAPDRPSTGADEVAARHRRAIEGVLGVRNRGNPGDVLRNGTRVFPMLARSRKRTARSTLTFVYWEEGRIGATSRLRAGRAEHGARAGPSCSTHAAPGRSEALVGLLRRPASLFAGSGRCTALRLDQMNHRTHRKVMIVDEDTAFMGGVGIADEWLGNAEDADH